jgi:predicted PurR-regulated permease PerM
MSAPARRNSAHAGRPRNEQVPIRTIVAAIGLVVVSIALIWLVITAHRALLWMLVAAFFAVALYPVVGWVEVHVTFGRRSLATLLVFTLASAIVAAVAAAVVVPLTREAAQVADDLPRLIDDTRHGRGTLGNLLERAHVLQYIQDHQDDIQQHLAGLSTPTLNVIRMAITGVFAGVTIFVLAYLMVLEGPIFIDSFLALFDPEPADRIRKVGADCATTITGYLSGNLLLSLICGASSYVVLKIVGAPFAGLVAVFVAITDLIPLVGATLGALVASADGFVHSVQAGVVLMVFFIAYQQVENHLLQPIIYARTVKLNPLTVIVSILIAVEIAGILGALLAIPVAGIIAIIARDVWDHRRGRPKSQPTVGEDHVPTSPTEGQRDEP